MTEAIDVSFVHDAVAVHDMTRLKKACEWQLRGLTTDRVKVAIALLEILYRAQKSAFYVAARQMTMADVDVITIITPFYSHLRESVSALSPYVYYPQTIDTATRIVMIGAGTDCDRAALVALAKWCWGNEHDDFCIRLHEVVGQTLRYSLFGTCGIFARDVYRDESGAVCDVTPTVLCVTLQQWKQRLARLIFSLEEGYISDSSCIELCTRLSYLQDELHRSPVSAEAKAEISRLLHRAWVAANCKWSLLRGAWIGSVVRVKKGTH